MAKALKAAALGAALVWHPSARHQVFKASPVRGKDEASLRVARRARGYHAFRVTPWRDRFMNEARGK